jgi:hypothetical protein
VVGCSRLLDKMEVMKTYLITNMFSYHIYVQSPCEHTCPQGQIGHSAAILRAKESSIAIAIRQHQAGQ